MNEFLHQNETTEQFVASLQKRLDEIFTRILSIKFSNRETLKPHLESLIRLISDLETFRLNENEKLQVEKALLNVQVRCEDLPYSFRQIVESALTKLVS